MRSLDEASRGRRRSRRVGALATDREAEAAATRASAEDAERAAAETIANLRERLRAAEEKRAEREAESARVRAEADAARRETRVGRVGGEGREEAREGPCCGERGGERARGGGD